MVVDGLAGVLRLSNIGYQSDRFIAEKAQEKVIGGEG
jgi:hypothetical protein